MLAALCAAIRDNWPTFLVAAAIYGLFGVLTACYHSLPWWLLLPLAAYVVAWHGSLQHEVVHGHPTPWHRLNQALVFPSLWLWLPFGHYRDTHLQHHRDPDLTDPMCDPESYYVTAATWRASSPWRRKLRWIYNTLAGRMLLGPLCASAGLWRREARRLAAGNTRHLTAWGSHAVGVALVLWWVIGVCGIPLWAYLILFAYPGTSLSLVRSFLEHQADLDWQQRTVAIEAHPLWALLFLNNNLHVLHHAEPGLPWHALEARWRARRTELLTINGGYRYRGYGEVIARYLLWPKEPPYHPLANAQTTSQPPLPATGPSTTPRFTPERSTLARR